jgi:hypothetical protein
VNVNLNPTVNIAAFPSESRICVVDDNVDGGVQVQVQVNVHAI